MPKVIAYHDVKDRDHWLASDLRKEKFGPLGVTDLRVFIDPANPVRVGLSADIPDMDAFVAWLQSDEGAAAMASDGVLPETVVMLIEA